VRLVQEGLKNRDIAARLRITEGTVKVYVHRIFDKIGVNSRTELAIKADQLVGRRSS
jgi:two-component system nitrate/nitrite response regulator NarL